MVLETENCSSYVLKDTIPAINNTLKIRIFLPVEYTHNHVLNVYIQNIGQVRGIKNTI